MSKTAQEVIDDLEKMAGDAAVMWFRKHPARNCICPNYWQLRGWINRLKNGKITVSELVYERLQL